jgi:RimJ/RimL family protein N-acetyltransferase
MPDEAGPVFAAAPPERIELPAGAALVRADPARAAAAAVAIAESREHLRPWMAWAREPATEAGLATFLATAADLWDRRRDFGFTIVDAATDAVLGGCGLHGRVGIDGLEIGYWVHVDRVGRGLATAAAAALVEAAFAIPGVRRIRIQCEDGNVRSARVPEKLGFRCDGVEVPEEGPCAGRPTQVWWLERAGAAEATS